MSDILWPKEYTPGFCDNYVSNEVIIPNLTTKDVWKFLNDTKYWSKYYANADQIKFYNSDGTELFNQARFKFTTFGFLVESEVVEYIAPMPGKPARVAWHGWVEGDKDHRLDVHHAWLIEDLEGGRVRVLTQETQNGKPAIELRNTLPNPMLNAHQAWLDGLVKFALENK